MIGRNLRIGAVRQEKFHQLGVAGLGGPHKRGCTGLEEPLHREDRPRQRVVLRPGIRIGPMVKQDFDVFQMIHVRLGHRIIATFDVAVVGRQV